MSNLNWGAILLAAACSFMLGGPWYSSALFGRVWGREAGQTKSAGQSHPARVFSLAFLFSLIAATAFACWLGPEPSLKRAVEQGLLVGGCFVATSFGINYQFANRSALMWLIDGGYHVAQFVLFGVVLGLCH